MSWHDLGIVLITVLTLKIKDEWKLWWADRREKKERPWQWECTTCHERGNFYKISSADVQAADDAIREHQKDTHGR